VAVTISNSGNNRIDYGDLSAFDSQTAMSFAFTLTPSASPAQYNYIFAQHNQSAGKGWAVRCEPAGQIAVIWGAPTNLWYGYRTTTTPLVSGRKISVVCRMWNMNGVGGRGADVWVNGVLQTMTQLYSNGSAAGTDNADSVTIGCDDEATYGCVAGDYAEVAAWTEKIPDEQAARISFGFSPATYLTNGIFYAPLYSTSDLTDRWGSATGTNYNATDAGHPRVLGFTWPSPMLLPKPASVRPDAGPDQFKRSVISQSFTLAGTAPPSGSGYTYLWTKLAHYAIGSSTRTPSMTSATAPEGVASAQYAETGYEGWRALDTGTTDGWYIAWRQASWWKYQFARATRIDRYGLVAATTTSRAPKAWTFEGSHDDSTWTTLGTETNVTGWSAGVEKTFPVQVDRAAAFRYYRISITGNNGDYHLQVKQIRLYSREATGTGTPTFTDNTSLTSGVTFNQFGTYLLQLKATSGGVDSYDNVEVTLEEGVPARVTVAPVEAAVVEAAGQARATVAPVEVLMTDDANPARVTQAVAELLQKQTASTRLTQLVAELLSPTVVQTRVTQLVAELLTLTVIETRHTQLVAEILNAQTTPLRLTQMVVEMLAKTSTYCGEPSFTPAALCGKPDVLAWLEWTVPMKEN
jgi:hypothetical protein